MKILFFGHRGWIAGYFLPLLREAGHEVMLPKGPEGGDEVRADDCGRVAELLDSVRPDRVVAFIGRTHGEGIGTIDYLEKPGKLIENVRDNLFAPVSLAMLCRERGVHFTYLGTGCIFSEEDPWSRMWGEADLPNFFGSSYSVVKGFTDRLMHAGLLAGNVLNVRIRMPITGDRAPRNFITKIVGYEKVCSMPNSMTVLPVLLPLLVDMIEKGHVGTVNLVNPGMMTHNEVLEMYRKIVDPGKTWVNFSVEEQAAVLASGRSNNQLDTGVLRAMYPEVPELKEAVRGCFEKMAASRT